MIQGYLNGVILLVALGLLVATVYGPWQWYCVDRARQRLFEIRARIFNLAATGQLPFETAHYRSIRDNLNKRLRFTHRVCWQQMLAIAWAYPNLPRESELIRQISLIEDPALRESLEREASKAGRAMAELIIFRSPLLLITYAVLRCVGSRRASNETQSAGERVSIEAENVGPILDQRLKAA